MADDNSVISDLIISSHVLCVDLDGTLLKTDSLHESLVAAVRARPDTLVRAPFWLAKGRSHLKRMIAVQASGRLDLERLPLNPPVERFIRANRDAGKRVELVTAADHEFVAANRWLSDMFDEVIGSQNGTNLKSEAKAKLLRERHPGGFAYVGNSFADLPVWRSAGQRFGVNLSRRLRDRVAQERLGLVELDNGAAGMLPALLRSMRIHQWLKNLLVFVPFFLSLQQGTPASFVTFVLAFLCLSALTSATYLANDLLDLDADRRHPRKRNRPLASGDLPLSVAASAGGLLIAASLVGAFLLSVNFFILLLCYLALTLAYSFRLKQLPLIDVIVVAALFTLRVVAGMALQGGHHSPWLLMFSIFFFLSLALMKREVELNTMAESGASVAHGRGYSVDDRPFVVSLGISTGVASLVVFSLFVSLAPEQDSSIYNSPGLLWVVMAILSYWLARMWLLTTRGQMNDDPILYAARDQVSIGLGALLLVVAVLAQFLELRWWW